MEVYALVGPSGTGKSHRALLVAQEYGISTLIDDGLLIQGSQIVAGSSAKREMTKLQAVRRAIFVDPVQAQDVREKLKIINPERLLVISTSRKMVARILQQLELPQPAHIILIEDIATREEIAEAREVRRREGKHVIPVPTIEVKKRFPGLLVAPLKVLFPRRVDSRIENVGEKSIVRPTFSYFGKLAIADAAIIMITNKLLEDVPGVRRALRTQINVWENQGVELNIDLQVVYGFELQPVLREVQAVIKEQVQYYTGLNVLRVNVTAKSIAMG
ncbi:MAG: Asp23/Gls24 family envelope stress response protein [bacterium]|jgi:adenylate kinase family enzyme